ncbi:MAG: heparan-alpha-glucosaminide N-acetyltransferase domain-containing protein [Vicinamibacterales bacterium]
MSTGAVRSRLAAIDIVRGAVIVLMALDHTRDFTTNLGFPPENLARASAVLFFTRWVTHVCAPTFVLLAGVGIGLMADRGLPARDLRRYLVTRGLWLIVLDLVITPLGWSFAIEPLPVYALVLWAIGLSMIAMAGAVALPRAWLLALSLAVIAGHNLTDAVRPPDLGPLAWLWTVLHAPGFLWPGGIFVGYPLVPWVAVVGVGVALADVYRWAPERRRRWLVGLGTAAVALFVVLRALNGYGNPAPWRPQATAALTAASFLNVLKYPPSLQFLLMTLGPALVALALAERARGWWAGWLATYGRVPLFFYCAHIFVVHAAAVAIAFLQGGELTRIQAVTHPERIPPWFGIPLPAVYLVWMGIVAALFWPCRAYGRLKASGAHPWTRYL